MAREKTWACKQNIALVGDNDSKIAKSWMYEFYTFLSGGAGNSTAAWEILSASNASSVGGPGTITGTGSITWNSSGAHTWWVCRKNILPVTASTTRYIYLTVDLEDSDDTKAYFSFDYDAPNFSGQSTSTRPAETARAYEKDGQSYRYEYDASNQAYFHGCIDTTGSFHAFSAQKNGTLASPYPFSISCMRLESPREPEVDPFPVLLRVVYSRGSNGSTSTYNHGCWSLGDNAGDTYNNINAGSGFNEWNDSNQNYGIGGFAMWWVDGVYDADGQNVGLMMPAPDPGIGNSPFYDSPASGDIIDGSYPLLPTFVGHYFGSNNVYNSYRGRIPDVFYTAGSVRMAGQTTGYGLGGLSIPLTGTIEYSCIADMFFPFSASIQPGG
jgi:hypothetical protein